VIEEKMGGLDAALETQSVCQVEYSPGITGQQEIWRPVVGHDDYYEVSDQGNVKSFVFDGRGRLLKPYAAGTNHLAVKLKGGARRYVHRLILTAFRGPCPDGWVARHINGVGADNRLDNIEWSSRSRNALDREQHYKRKCKRVPDGKRRVIGERLAEGRPLDSHRAIAMEMGVSRQTVRRIHLTMEVAQ
jgi:hypothetical protein